MQHLERHKEANIALRETAVHASRLPCLPGHGHAAFGGEQRKVCVLLVFLSSHWRSFCGEMTPPCFCSPTLVWVSESRPLPCFCHQFPQFILPINHPGELYRPTKAFKVNGKTNHVKSAVKPTFLPPWCPGAPAPPGSGQAAHFLPSQLALNLGQGPGESQGWSPRDDLPSAGTRSAHALASTTQRQ